jgi:probable HAF family extracellular repeat protein
MATATRQGREPMKRLLAAVSALALLAALTSGVARAEGGYSITDLGTLGGTYSEANAISANGKIVGRASLSGSFPYHAFLYTNGTMTDLGTLGGADSDASDVNEVGEVVGSSTNAAGKFRAFLYAGASMLDLGTLGGPWSFGWAINDAGVVVGGADTSASGRHAFRYSGGVMTDLGVLPGAAYSSANAINAAGTIVGDSGPIGSSSVFGYGLGGMVDLGTFGGTLARGVDVNDFGDILVSVGTGTGTGHGVISSASGPLITLGTLEAISAPRPRSTISGRSWAKPTLRATSKGSS